MLRKSMSAKFKLIIVAKYVFCDSYLRRGKIDYLFLILRKDTMNIYPQYFIAAYMTYELINVI